MAATAVAWALVEGYPWWPVYLCDTKPMQQHVHLPHDDLTVQSMLATVQQAPTNGILAPKAGTNLLPWLCLSHRKFLRGFPVEIMQRSHTFPERLAKAVQEAMAFLSGTMTLPFVSSNTLASRPPSNAPMNPPTACDKDVVEVASRDTKSTPSQRNSVAETNRSRSAVPNEIKQINHVAWSKLKHDAQLWPVYVCDPSVMREWLHHLGHAHRSCLEIAKTDDTNCLVFAFGVYTFHLVPPQSIQTWASHSIAQQPPSPDAPLEWAIEEASTYLTSDESTRTLPYLVPSDMNPSSQLPPPSQKILPPGSVVWTVRTTERDQVWWPGVTCDSEATSTNHTTCQSQYRIALFGTDHTVIIQKREFVKLWPDPVMQTLLVRGYPSYIVDTALATAIGQATQAYVAAKSVRPPQPSNYSATSSDTRAAQPSTTPPYDPEHASQPATEPEPAAATQTTMAPPYRIPNPPDNTKSSSTSKPTSRGPSANVLAWRVGKDDTCEPVYVVDAAADVSTVYSFESQSFASVMTSQLRSWRGGRRRRGGRVGPKAKLAISVAHEFIQRLGWERAGIGWTTTGHDMSWPVWRQSEPHDVADQLLVYCFGDHVFRWLPRQKVTPGPHHKRPPSESTAAVPLGWTKAMAEMEEFVQAVVAVDEKEAPRSKKR
ncbi:hypothetical protein, variant 1 [Aphanomyces astaci]|uniref:PWWP domain-containing protein n=1 Tax=Aphanomyces astaci TaxID=112090 RepID=W4FYT5_APHAT|nr:hypothetical protein, variant 1 [Aphanomyces astaci]ETV72622.1 hypothetical protein, variant 1 [Aphanomyces astaci]|eukprot:XP_009837851.1 hypothetical protein, variant 1 [Aphanomyces astaci]